MRLICFKEFCKHKCDVNDECTREITVIDSAGTCKNYHPVSEKKKDDVY